MMENLLTMCDFCTVPDGRGLFGRQRAADNRVRLDADRRGADKNAGQDVFHALSL